jgi:hypothetical protein
MSTIDSPTIKKILNLRSALISPEIAERQIEVIRRGFNHLNQVEENSLYIADEVGLGKTYIAAGIASLLRHFAPDPASYQDVILVPKSNLQSKWEKEIRQFIANNYLQKDNRVKSVTGTPIGEIIRKEQIQPVEHDHPAYHLYRNSQFSLGFNWRENKREQLQNLKNRLVSEQAREIFERAVENGLTGKPKSYIKKLYAYLLSICHPEIELLIVDEGHNYKYGLGESDDDEVSDRNNVVARFFGLKRNTEEDKLIFQDFPELRRLIQPKVKKLIMLSATPKTDQLLEIKNQLDCFLPHHILSGFKTNEAIKEKLPNFFIRGNMEYTISGSAYTRNQCRYEHRKGNVLKLPEAPQLTVQDPEQAIIMGLLQYNTIKHLDAKNNATFELGMLAGFETFQVDQMKRSKQINKQNENEDYPEYEEVRTRKIRQSQDYNVLKNIIESYKQTFGCLPPHPKQDAIVEGACQMMMRGEKSLIFVRRVASAFELERRLLDQWENVIAAEIEKKWKKQYPSKELNQLLASFKDIRENREVVDNLERIFGLLSAKVLKSYRNQLEEQLQEQLNENLVKQGLYLLYNYRTDVPDIGPWYEQIRQHANLKITRAELVEQTFNLLMQFNSQWLEMLKVKESTDGDVEEEDYFFHRYFSEEPHKSFRKRIYNADWFEINYFMLNEQFRIAAFDPDVLIDEVVNKQVKSGNNIAEVQEYFLKHLSEALYRDHLVDRRSLHPLLNQPTFITELLIHHCKHEVEEFIEKHSLRSKSSLFEELSYLSIIIRSVFRNGSGFLPLFIADKSNRDFSDVCFDLLSDESSLFNLTLKEIKAIINDYELIRAVNFSAGESKENIQRKLLAQSPVVGLTGQSKRRTPVATQFRMPGFPYVLITTDIFREGEDLHTYCQNIYHYGIAWNCSDMEQRTGRIDRINSMSHRKMDISRSVNFDERVHVFYPYIKQTLEVNQVSKLFKSINSFIETFNDFTEPILNDGVAVIKDSIIELPETIQTPLRSKYEYWNFKGADTSETSLIPNVVIGKSENELGSLLIELELLLLKQLQFYYKPVLDLEKFELRGDVNLANRRNRRGPFVIRIVNGIQPGEFCLYVASHIFRSSNRLQRAVEDHSRYYYSDFIFDSIGEYNALSFRIATGKFSRDIFLTRFLPLLEAADEVEEQFSGGHDLAVYGV